MKAELIPWNGDPPIPITQDVTVVGRREFCDVVIHHPSLSKRHCVLVRTDGLLVVRDLISTNGTKVNGQRVMWAALLPNDKLTLGRVKFKVYLGPDDAPSPSELGQRAASKVAVGAEPLAAGLGSPTKAPTGFPAPSPLGMPVVDTSEPKSADDEDPTRLASRPAAAMLDDEDLEILNSGEGFEIIDDDEPYIIDLD